MRIADDDDDDIAIAVFIGSSAAGAVCVPAAIRDVTLPAARAVTRYVRCVLVLG